jgi:hypothetical protein
MTSPADFDDTGHYQKVASDLASCRVEDFDGHTAFASLSAEQRLAWADRAARLVVEFQGRNNGDGGLCGGRNRGREARLGSGPPPAEPCERVSRSGPSS